MEQYELDTFGRSHDIMSNFWNSCFDDLMSTAIKRDKDRSDSKSKFQVIKASGWMYNSCLSVPFELYWSDLCWRVSRKWSWTLTWRESEVRTTGTSTGRSRAPASRGWCGSTGKLYTGFWRVREEHGPTGQTASHSEEISLYLIGAFLLKRSGSLPKLSLFSSFWLTEFNQRWN